MERMTNEDWMMVFFTKAAASLQCNDITVDNWFVPRHHSPHISFSSNTGTHSHSDLSDFWHEQTNNYQRPSRTLPQQLYFHQTAGEMWHFNSVTYKAFHSSNGELDVTHCNVCYSSGDHPSTDWIFLVCRGKTDRDVATLPANGGNMKEGIKAQCCACRLTTWNDYTSHTFPHQNCVNVVMLQINSAASNQPTTLPHISRSQFPSVGCNEYLCILSEVCSAPSWHKTPGHWSPGGDNTDTLHCLTLSLTDHLQHLCSVRPWLANYIIFREQENQLDTDWPLRGSLLFTSQHFSHHCTVGNFGGPAGIQFNS